MFKAVLNNEVIFSFDIINKHKMKIQTLEAFYRSEGHKKTILCQSCGDPVLLKAGDKNVPHFSHYKRNYTCKANKEMSFESEEHKLGIMLIYNYLKRHAAYEILDIDYKLPFRRRANIYFKSKNEFAIEFVANPMQYKAWVEKHKDYIENNIIPIWILSSKSFSEMHDDDYNFFERTLELEDTNGILYLFDTENIQLSMSKYMPFLIDGQVAKRGIFKEKSNLESIKFDEELLFDSESFINNYWHAYSDYITEMDEKHNLEINRQKKIDKAIKNRVEAIGKNKEIKKDDYAICMDCGSYSNDYWYLEASGLCRCYCTIKKRK